MKYNTQKEKISCNFILAMVQSKAKGGMPVRLTFTEQEIANEIHKIYIEEDDLLLEAEVLEGEGKLYKLTGIATIEGERYHDFEIEFALLEEPEEMSAEAILSAEWDWYDYVC